MVLATESQRINTRRTNKQLHPPITGGCINPNRLTIMSKTTTTKPTPPIKLQLGKIVATQECVESVDLGEVQTALNRHHNGDWGEVDQEDKKTNDDALQLGNRVLSVYTSTDQIKFWIITEADRSVTTALLPSEY